MEFNYNNHKIANAYPLNGRECIKTTSTRIIAILKWTLILAHRHSMQTEHKLHKCHHKMDIYITHKHTNSATTATNFKFNLIRR